VKAVTRHDIGRTTEDTGRVLFYIDQLKDAELAFLVVEKKVNIGAILRLAARGRTEKIEMLDRAA
jgi:hypothetical protein